MVRLSFVFLALAAVTAVLGATAEEYSGTQQIAHAVAVFSAVLFVLMLVAGLMLKRAYHAD
jgi:uncharacterized membrane protein YtjA (UPF0391 family)